MNNCLTHAIAGGEGYLFPDTKEWKVEEKEKSHSFPEEEKIKGRRRRRREREV
jgi:hypothetical protein